MRTEPESKNWCGYRALSEIFLAIRFGLVGVLSTGVHVSILWILLSKTLLPVLVANAMAFICAFGLSFAGHYIWTFQAPGNPSKAIQRFLLISLLGLFVNTVVLAAVLKLKWFSPFAAAIASTVVIPLITFLLSRLWGFRNAAD